VFPELTALENLLVATRGRHEEAVPRARELLRFVKLERLAGNTRATSPTGSRNSSNSRAW
jgi:hypothetical protein